MWRHHSFILKESGENLDKPCSPCLQSSRLKLKDESFKFSQATGKSAACGQDKAIALSSLNLPLAGQGELFAFGCNGQLSLGDNNRRNIPILLKTHNNIVTINGEKIKIKWDPCIYTTLSKNKYIKLM